MKPIAIITGASQGIGRAVALGLAVDGYHSCLVARNHKNLEILSKEIAEAGGSSTIFLADLSETDSVNKLVREISEQFESCEILFNNVATWSTGLFDVELEEWEAVFQTNLTSP